jgi:hypothetical protein
MGRLDDDGQTSATTALHLSAYASKCLNIQVDKLNFRKPMLKTDDKCTTLQGSTFKRFYPLRHTKGLSLTSLNNIFKNANHPTKI